MFLPPGDMKNLSMYMLPVKGETGTMEREKA